MPTNANLLEFPRVEFSIGYIDIEATKFQVDKFKLLLTKNADDWQYQHLPYGSAINGGRRKGWTHKNIRIFLIGNHYSIQIGHRAMPYIDSALQPVGSADLVRKLRGLGQRIKRIDWTFDILNDHPDWDYFRNIFRSNAAFRDHVCGNFKLRPEGNADEDQTFYIGRKGANFQLRIYERETNEFYKQRHPRFEIQARFEEAAKSIELYERDGKAGILAYLKSKITFRTPTEDSNKSRWPDAEWFKELIEGASSLTEYLPEAEEAEDPFYGSARWLQDKIAGTLKAVYEHPRYGLKWIQMHLLMDQDVKIPRKLSAALRDAKESQGSQAPITPRRPLIDPEDF